MEQLLPSSMHTKKCFVFLLVCAFVHSFSGQDCQKTSPDRKRRRDILEYAWPCVEEE